MSWVRSVAVAPLHAPIADARFPHRRLQLAGSAGPSGTERAQDQVIEPEDALGSFGFGMGAAPQAASDNAVGRWADVVHGSALDGEAGYMNRILHRVKLSPRWLRRLAESAAPW